MGLSNVQSNYVGARGLPVDGTIDYRTLGPVDPVGEWPPRPIQRRMDRLCWLWELYNGDFRDLRDDVTPTRTAGSVRSQFTVQANPFRMIPVAFADLIMMTPPEYADPRQSVNIQAALYDIVVHQFVYGAAVVLATGDPGDPLEVLEPSWWVPTEDGWWYAEPMADMNGNYHSVNIRSYSESEASITECEYYFGGTRRSSIGAPLGDEEETEALVDPLRVIARSPRHWGGTWGTSILEDIASPVAAINQRYSDIDAFLRKQATPNLMVRVADADRNEIAGDLSPDATFNDSVSAVGAKLEGYDNQTKWVMSDAIQGTEALVWDARVDESLMFVDHMYNVIEASAAIPGLFKGFLEIGGAVSGIAVKRILARFIAAAGKTKKATEVAVNELLELSEVTPVAFPEILSGLDDPSAPAGQEMVQ